MRHALRAIAIAFVVLFVAACGHSNSSNSSSNASATPSNGTPVATSTSRSPAPSSASVSNTGSGTPVERVVRQFQPSVVRISVSAPAQGGRGGIFGGVGASRGGQGQAQPQGTGTGIVLDNDGHILTNNHVVTLDNSTTATSVSVDLPSGKTAQANVVGTDPQTDLAVIQVGSSDRSGLQPIQWESSDNIVIGQEVVAIGYALDLGGAPTVTTGVVSAIDRSIPETDATISGAIQTDAAINPGNSGGPLIDLNGKVIGLNTAGLVGTPNQPAEGINFAISSQTAQPVSTALISQGHVTRGYMGVAVTDITPEMAKANNLGVSSGAGVGQVTSGSPAAQAGLQPGDVITKVGDVAINNTGDLTNALTKYGPSQKVPVAYERSGKQQTTTITLGQRPASPTG